MCAAKREKKTEKMRVVSVEETRERRGLCIYRQAFRIYTQLTNCAGPEPASSFFSFYLPLTCLADGESFEE